jgi:hypothetical protein
LTITDSPDDEDDRHYDKSEIMAAIKDAILDALTLPVEVEVESINLVEEE